jgi:hypothetical protein
MCYLFNHYRTVRWIFQRCSKRRLTPMRLLGVTSQETVMFTHTALRTSNLTCISMFGSIFCHYVIHVYVIFGRCSLFVLHLILLRFPLFIPHSILLLITHITPHNGPLFRFFLCYLLFLHVLFCCVFLLNLLSLLLLPLYLLLFPSFLHVNYVGFRNFKLA